MRAAGINLELAASAVNYPRMVQRKLLRFCITPAQPQL
jgi:hypothetical protein